MARPVIVRAATVPVSLDVFCRGLLRELSAHYDVVALSSPGTELDTIGRREGVRTCAVPMRRDIAPLADVRALWRLWRVMRRERPAMVHSMTPKAGLLCMLAAWMARVPVRVHTFTGLLFPTATGLKRRLLMLTDRITCACATHIVPEGEGVRADLAAARITRKPMRVLGHGNVRGIDLDHYSRTPAVVAGAAALRARLGYGPQHVVFVFVGRVVADKGIRELVEAFATLGSDARLVLVGPQEPDLDPLDADTLRRIRDDARIHLAGEQSDVRPWLAMADVLVHPSYREGFPNVVIEAGAMGLPAIVTDINGSREIIEHGRNGLIVPPRRSAPLAAAMKRLFDDDALRRSLATPARPMIASRFEQSYVRACLKAFYRSLLKKN